MAQAVNRVTTPERQRTRGVIQELAERAGKDRDVLAVLDRLAKDVDALDAIAAITEKKAAVDLDRQRKLVDVGDDAVRGVDVGGDAVGVGTDSVRRLLELCLQAAFYLREYSKVLKDMRARGYALPKHRESVSDLRRLIEWAAAYRYHPLIDWMPIAKTEQERIDRDAHLERAQAAGLLSQQQWRRAQALMSGSAESFCATFDHLDALIDQQQKLLQENPPFDLVTSRKAATKAAAAKSVIGWLAEQIGQMFGKPHTRHVATLAGVALDIGEVSEKRVLKALEARRKKLAS